MSPALWASRFGWRCLWSAVGAGNSIVPTVPGTQRCVCFANVRCMTGAMCLTASPPRCVPSVNYMPTLDELYHLAKAHHQQGNLALAEPIYRQILQADPSHAAALHHLGMVAQQTGHLEAALALLRRSLAVNPDNADAHNSLGTILKDQDQ